MNNVKSIEFTDEDSGNGSGNNQETTSSLIGTWKKIESGIDGASESVESIFGIKAKRYFQFRADGSYIYFAVKEDDTVINRERGTWYLNNHNLITKIEEADEERYIGVTYTYAILYFESDMITLSYWGLTVNLEKVSDSEIEKYL